MSSDPTTISIEPWSGPAPSATVHVPGSKSLTNRALIIAAMADGPSVLDGALQSEDTEVMVKALGGLGISAHFDVDSATIAIDGCGGSFPRREASLYVANSGTSLRFLTAMLATGHGHLPPRRHSADAPAPGGRSAHGLDRPGCHGP